MGIYQSQEEIDNREVKQYLGDVRPGDLMFKDQNGDNRIDAYDQVALGYNSTCPEIYYSFDLGAEYKGWGVYALFQGTGNYSKLLDTRSIYRPIVGNNTISTYYYENRWTPDNQDAKYPRLSTQSNTNNYQTNTVWLADRSFLKLRNIEVYYNFPKSWLQKTKFIGDARLYVRGVDLLCFDKIDVLDPESYGATNPLNKSLIVGLKVGF